MFRRRVLRDERVAGEVTTCPNCGNQMTSLPELYWDEDGIPGWWVGFYCPVDRATFPVWAPSDDPVIDEITRGVDIQSLPLWPEGHETPKADQ
jgi:hypothetical protein